MRTVKHQPLPGCTCGEIGSRCCVCLTAAVMGLRVRHETVTVSLVRRVMRDELTGREIALLLEAMRYDR